MPYPLRPGGNSALGQGYEAMRRIRNLIKDERGATAVEYGLILAMIFFAMIAGVATFATTTTQMWDNVANEVSSR